MRLRYNKYPDYNLWKINKEKVVKNHMKDGDNNAK